MADAVNKQAKLQEAMSRAKKLINLDANGTLDKIAKGARDGINESMDGSVQTEQLMTTPRNRRTEAPMVGQKMGANAMNVPAAIRESFAKMTINDSDLYGAFGGGGGSDGLSFLTEGIESAPRTNERVNAQTQNVSQLVSEGLGRTQPQYVQQGGQQIDYPMIRTIVEEIVRKYAVSLKNKILTENKQSSSNVDTIVLGNTFKFLAKNGDIYECTMRKVSNLNEVKNKRGIVK